MGIGLSVVLEAWPPQCLASPNLTMRKAQPDVAGPDRSTEMLNTGVAASLCNASAKSACVIHLVAQWPGAAAVPPP